MGLGDGADGATTALVLHGLPPLQFSGYPPPNALQVQAPVKLSRTQRNTWKTQTKEDNKLMNLYIQIWRIHCMVSGSKTNFELIEVLYKLI